MALEEHPREDLLRDGVTMPVRGRWLAPDGQSVFVGFRSNGQMSLYLGEDPVYQFNTQHALRRAFVAGQRYAAEAGRLQRLTAPIRGSRLQFQHVLLDDVTSAGFLAECEARLQMIEAQLATDDLRCLEARPDVAEFIACLRDWCARRPARLSIAQASRA